MDNEELKDAIEKIVGRKGGLRRIGDLPREMRPCPHPEHMPPSMIVLRPGVYEHTCPACGHVTTFTVQGHYCRA